MLRPHKSVPPASPAWRAATRSPGGPLEHHLRGRGIKATITQPADQRAQRQRKGSAGGRPPAFDKLQYRRRNTVERCVHKWKQYRAVATRYDKRDYVYNGTLTVAAIMIWLRDTVQEPSETP
ncbi:transposase [Actinomadura sp. NEAU-AAG5]|uniref:Transposase n=1 Tax=Actinomadura litoris TaxID=2678616 RepID=A0A7K1LA07_9ACTN|nr:transposase [Actinomadura litoris]